MSKYSATDDTAETSDSDIISSYNESFSIGKDGAAQRIVRGERKVAGQYTICGFLGRYTKPVKSSSGGKK